MENFKRSVKRLITRLTILGLVVICGAIAIAQAQRERVVANAAAPDLGAPTTTLNDAESAVLNALAVPDQRPVAKPATWAGPTESTDFIADDNVAAVQAIDASSRYDDPLPTAEVPATSKQPATANRFTNFDTQFTPATESNPPALLSGSEIEAPPLASPLPPADTSLPFGQAPRNDSAPPPPAQNQPEPVAPSPRNAYANDTFGVQPPPTANPIRDDATPAVRERTPVAAAAAPLFDPPPTLPQQQEPGDSSSQGSSVLPPARSYVENTVNLSGAGKPGPRELEGAQSPSLTIQKIAPTDARVGEPATFQIKVRNNGQVPAERVLIRDEVPLGTELVGTDPQAATDSSGAVIWEIGTIRPSEDVTVSMQVSPNQEGPIGSVASVTFEALASAPH